MSDKRFVDTNILVYAHDLGSGVKHQRARALVEELWASLSGVLSTQVLQELCVSLRRKVQPAIPSDEVRQLVQDYLSWEVVVNTGASILEALEMEARYRISFWDALILQSATQSGAAVVYSEDFADRQYYGSVKIINPFVESPS